MKKQLVTALTAFIIIGGSQLAYAGSRTCAMPKDECGGGGSNNRCPEGTALYESKSEGREIWIGVAGYKGGTEEIHECRPIKW